MTNRFYRRDPSSVGDLPEAVAQVLTSVEASFLHGLVRGHQRRFSAISESYFREGLGVGPRERAALEAGYLAT